VLFYSGQTTSVFHQITLANSASYPQQDGMNTSQSEVTLCGWGVKVGIVDKRVGGR